MTREDNLASVLRRASAGIRLNGHIDAADGAAVFRPACKLRLEGIVSKRKDSQYRSGPRTTGSRRGTRIARPCAEKRRKNGAEASTHGRLWRSNTRSSSRASTSGASTSPTQTTRPG